MNIKITSSNLHMRILFFISIVLFLSFPIVGQENCEAILKIERSAEVKYSQGIYYTYQSKYDSAIYRFLQARIVFEELKLYDRAIESTIRICEILLSTNQADSALKYANNAILISQNSNFYSAGNEHILEELFFTLGNIYSSTLNHSQAIEYYNQCLNLALSDSNILSKNNMIHIYYNYLGMVYEEIGSLDNAIKSYNKSQETTEMINGSKLGSQYVNNFINIGSIYLKKCDFDRALLYYKKALNFHNESNYIDPLIKGVILNNLGLVYFEMKNLDYALKYFNESLKLAQLSNNEIDVAPLYNNLGDVFRQKVNISKALIYYRKALNIYRHQLGQNSLEAAYLYNNIANVYKDLNLVALAEKYYYKSLNIRQKILGDKHFRISQNFQNLAILMYRSKKYEKALRYCQNSLIANIYEYNSENINSSPSIDMSISSNIDFLETIILKANTFYQLFLLHEDSISFLYFAISNYQLSLDIADEIRNSYSSTASKLLVNEVIHDIYPNILLAIIELNKIEKTNNSIQKLLKNIERNKSFILYAALLESKAKNLSGIPDSLLIVENNFKQDLAYLSTILNNSTKDIDSLTLVGFENQYYYRTRQYDSLILYYHKNYPQYYRLKFDLNVTSLIEIQNSLSLKEALIEYFLTDSLIFIITITRNSQNLIIRDIDDEFESISRDHIRHIKQFNFQSYIHSARYLYSKLIEPINNHLSSIERLIIIPHDYLYYVPFETLINNNSNSSITNFSQNEYLVKQYEVVYHYSSTLWSTIRKKTPLNESLTEYDFVGFAPVFKDNESSAQLSTNMDEVLRQSQTNRGNVLTKLKFNELPFSREEILDIIDLFSTNGKSTNAFLNAEATEKNFRSILLKSKLIHIATHGILNDEFPDLSGLIFYDSSNTIIPTIEIKNDSNTIILEDYNFNNDGILFSNEVYNLSTNANLLVLSACNTGAGRLVKGEGLMAVTRGFVYAGANNIINSLWKISDKHTRDLMVWFYSDLIAGNGYSKSLKNAKNKMIKNQKTSYPLLWAGFLLVGH